MSDEINEILNESVKEIERKKRRLLDECSLLEESLKTKEVESSKLLTKNIEEADLYVINKKKEIDKLYEETLAIRKSLDGSEDTLKSISDGFDKLDADKVQLVSDMKEFENYKQSEHQKIDDRIKEIELREAKLKEV